MKYKAIYTMNKVFSFRLDNNLLVICAKDKSNPLVSIQLWIRIGSNWETDENAGCSHFIEHIVFKGTKKFAMDEISQLIPSVGGASRPSITTWIE